MTSDRWIALRAVVGAGVAAAVLLVMRPGPATGQLYLPDGFSASYEADFSYGKRELTVGGNEDDQRVWENWVDIDYTRGEWIGGVRFVAFQPPDPTIYPSLDGTDTSSFGFDLGYVEYGGSRLTARGGSFYSLFGRGLTLRMYEDRTLRVDTNGLGGKGTFFLPDGELTALIGATVKNTAVQADRGRTEPVYGVDFQHGIWSPANLRIGVGFASTAVDAGAGSDLEPIRIKGVRAAATLGSVDLAGEFARVDGPNVFPELDKRGFEGPNYHGHGIYASASTAIGSASFLFEVKDYDALVFRNNDNIDHNLPPAGLRDHPFSLLNRHPHQLDTSDEIGFQVETTYVTDAITSRGYTSVLANWSSTRNHDDEQQGNHFDDGYFEIQQEAGERATVIGGVSYQRSFVSAETPDPLRTLWTPVADLRYRVTDTYALHVQYEHQHDTSDLFGEFDVDFLILEWSRSPNLTLGFLMEHTNKSDLQLERLGEKDTGFFAGTLDYTLFGSNDLRFFYGTRNAGFICVGGVCRFEPAFDGFEMTLVSRF